MGTAPPRRVLVSGEPHPGHTAARGGEHHEGERSGTSETELLSLAIDVAHSAGALLLERFESGHERALGSKSSPTDLVSEADIESERTIRELLERARPDDGFLGEEGGEQGGGNSGLCWVVDPLDGTVNFLFGIPQWSVSVAVRDEHGTLAGAVFDPCRGELFSAMRGGSAMLSGTLIEASGCEDLASAMLATGLAYEADVRVAQAEVLARVIPRVRDIRRFGSAALDLAWTAAGRYDAYFERSVKPWDIAAGTLICARAGHAVHELPATGSLPSGVLVAAPALAGRLLELVG